MEMESRAAFSVPNGILDASENRDQSRRVGEYTCSLQLARRAIIGSDARRAMRRQVTCENGDGQEEDLYTQEGCGVGGLVLKRSEAMSLEVAKDAMEPTAIPRRARAQGSAEEPSWIRAGAAPRAIRMPIPGSGA